MCKIYLYSNAAPAIPPPHWATMKRMLLNREILLSTPIAIETDGFTCAPRKNNISFNGSFEKILSTKNIEYKFKLYSDFRFFFI